MPSLLQFVRDKEVKIVRPKKLRRDFLYGKNLIEYSKQVHNEASKVLEYTDIVKKLSKVGKVSFIGSYALNTMYRRDIDIVVWSKKPMRSIANVLTKDFIDSDLFQTIEYDNWFNYKHESTYISPIF